MSATIPPINPAPSSAPIQPPDKRALQILHELEISSGLNCHQVGIIQSFDPDTATAVVAIAMKKIIGFSVISYPVLAKVPVVQVRGGAGFITFPIAAGDECLVFFNDRDIDAWWTSGQFDAPPNTNRFHDLSDGLCFVGPLSKGNAGKCQYSTTDILLGFAGALLDIGPEKFSMTIPTGSGTYFSITIGNTTISSDGTTVTIANGSMSIALNGTTTTISDGTTALTLTGAEISLSNADALFKMNTGSPESGRFSQSSNGVSIKAILDNLMFALLAWQNTSGDGPNPTTVARLTAVQTAWDAFYS